MSWGKNRILFGNHPMRKTLVPMIMTVCHLVWGWLWIAVDQIIKIVAQCSPFTRLVSSSELQTETFPSGNVSLFWLLWNVSTFGLEVACYLLHHCLKETLVRIVSAQCQMVLCLCVIPLKLLNMNLVRLVSVADKTSFKSLTFDPMWIRCQLLYIQINWSGLNSSRPKEETQ